MAATGMIEILNMLKDAIKDPENKGAPWENDIEARLEELQDFIKKLISLGTVLSQETWLEKRATYLYLKEMEELNVGESS